MNKTPFADYVSLAGHGRHGLGSILVGFVAIVVLWVAGSFAAIVGGGLVAAWFDPATGFSYEAALSGRIGAFTLLLSIALLWPTVAIVLRFVHRRHLVTVLGTELRIDRSDLWRGLGAAIVVSVVGAVAWAFVGDDLVRTDTSVVDWLVWLVPLLLLVLLQASAEELLFRGYFMQLLARRFRSPAIWAGLPTILFTLLHWYPEATPAMNAAVLVTIGAFAASAAFLVVHTGNLGAAVGVHWGNNILALLLFSADDELDSVAFLSTRAIGDPSWTTNEAVNLAAFGILSSLATLWLLLHPRSPLRLRSRTDVSDAA